VIGLVVLIQHTNLIYKDGPHIQTVRHAAILPRYALLKA